MTAQHAAGPLIRVAIEAGSKRAFATAVDWPGWARSGRTEAAALESLASYAPRYLSAIESAGQALGSGTSPRFEVVERGPGGGGTDFGVPSRVTDPDRRPATADEAARLARIVAAAWSTFDRVARAAPAQLRLGPRGGGRDRDRMVRHVVEAEHAYANEIGIRVPAPDPADHAAVSAMRAAMLEVLGAPSDGSPLAGRRWPPRYAAHRIAWHALDHAWEIEDRSEPLSG